VIKLPDDGRAVAGRRIEGLVFALDELVTDYLNMLSLADRPQGEAKVREAFKAHPVIHRVLFGK
jgi:hypothetical protein